MAKKAPAKVARKKAAKVAKKAKPSSKTTKKAKAPRKQNTRPKPELSLGRPKVTGEEQLYMLFREDYHARQIFDFLRVQTVKELEHYSPQQIVKLLSKPITDTVNRIRRKLAEKNRHLQDDLPFAVDYNQRNQDRADS